MVLLLEGPEKSGKTTLAREIIKQSRVLKVDAVHASNRGCAHPQHYSDLMALGDAPDVLVVMDRAWPSECVYSKLLNRQSALMPFEEHRFEAELDLVGLKYILAPVERREPLDETDYQVSYDAERQMYLDYSAACMKYRVLTTWDVDAATGEIIAELRKMQQRKSL